MNSKLRFTTVVIVFALLTYGCATIITGTSQKITFKSDPNDAIVLIDGKTVGKTPVVVTVDKKTDQTFTFKKDGYKTYSAKIKTTFNGWFFGNIIFGGLLGSTTDGISGSIHKISPEEYFVILSPENSFGQTISLSTKLKDLILSSGMDLRSELAVGRGERLDSVLNLLEIKELGRQKAIKNLHRISLENENDLALAEAIIKEYKVKK